MDHNRSPLGVTLGDATRRSRRRLLAAIVALTAVCGLGFLTESESSAARKEKKKRKQRGDSKKKNKKEKRKKDSGGSGSGGGGYSPDGEERAFLDLINAYRRQHGAGDLSLQHQLGAAAEYHSQDMADKNYFSHRLANGDSPEENIKRFGYTGWSFVGENIAAGQETAKDVMAAWKSSPEHDRGMRDKNFTEIGIGRAYDKNSKYGWYWTTTFGSR